MIDGDDALAGGGGRDSLLVPSSCLAGRIGSGRRLGCRPDGWWDGVR